MRANIIGFHHALHTNKYSEVDCSVVVLDSITPGVSPCLTHGSEPSGMPCSSARLTSPN